MNANDGESINKTTNKQWKRVLYERQNYKDNYIDPTKFLDQLVLCHPENEKLPYTDIFISASFISQQFTVNAIFLTTYKYILIDTENDIALQLFIVDLFLLSFGYYLVYSLLDHDNGKVNLINSIQTTLLFIVCLRITPLWTVMG